MWNTKRTLDGANFGAERMSIEMVGVEVGVNCVIVGVSDLDWEN